MIDFSARQAPIFYLVKGKATRAIKTFVNFSDHVLIALIDNIILYQPALGA